MKLKGRNLAGSNDRKRDTDFYPTPKWATDALLEREKFNQNIWEPACGNGMMTKVLEEYGYNVYSSDLNMFKPNFGQEQINFLRKVNLNNVPMHKFDIVTNPPFMYAKEFVERAKKRATNKVAMFLKLVFLEGITRYEFFKDKNFPLKKVYVFCKRVNLYKNGVKGNNSGTIAFAWFVWDKTYKGNPEIDWINDRGEK